MLAIESLHKQDIIHRDIKAENIFISSTGHLKLADYGQAKDHLKSSQTTQTICGSPDYLAPEIIFKKPYNRSIDWWQLGVLLYHLLAGKTPFHNENPYVLIKNITELKYDMKEHFSDSAKSLIS